MNLAELQSLLRHAPLVASVQGSPDSPVEHPETLLRLAQASLQSGAKALRLQGVENIRLIRAETHAPVIGLLKVDYEGFAVRITPTLESVRTLIELGCEVIALDGTSRPRPDGSTLRRLIEEIHSAGRIAMADCDNLESVRSALEAGADLVGTTLSGYTEESRSLAGPDLDLVEQASRLAPGRVVAEGRYSEPWQAQAARRRGAVAVVIGGALNDPIKQTRAFASAVEPVLDPVGAIDIGGTWLRFAVVSPSLEVLEVKRTPLRADRAERMAWLQEHVTRSGVRRVGVGTGGVVNPRTREVVAAKPLIPDHVGTVFEFEGAQTAAMNDGLATAWGHACHPAFAGKRVATLALGTGVGFGLVDRGRILMSAVGEPPHLNDSWTRTGRTFEQVLGGLAISEFGPNADEELLQAVAEEAEQMVSRLFHPDAIVVCGGVGLSGRLSFESAVITPFGADAGLIGAACLALFPPTP